MTPQTEKTDPPKDDTTAAAAAAPVIATDVEGEERPRVVKTESGSTVRVPEVLDAPATEMHPGPIARSE